MITDGPYFTSTMDALRLPAPQRRDAESNATSIVSATMQAFGVTRGGALAVERIPNSPVTGLVYGRIQSGKTRAMIASTAMAFDNGFRISIVMTSNINDLVAQTHLDFTRGLPGIVIFTKDNDFEREEANTRLHLERGSGRLLLVCSKGKVSLDNIISFLQQIRAELYPVILFDDEGDQASLDTNAAKRNRSQRQGGPDIDPSSINDIIQNQLRPAVPKHVYVSVTGTPQAILLQSADSANRPSFIRMLPPGRSYVGGDKFFHQEEPELNSDLIAVISPNDQSELLDASQPIPSGLKQSLLFFLVSGVSAIKNLELPEAGYSYLCHPSLRNVEQGIAEGRINAYLTDVYEALLARGASVVLRELRSAHAELSRTLGDATPTFEETLALLRIYLPTRRLLVINARVKRQGIIYGRGLNFLIGGNTLGRGIAIKDLLVTYYVRDARVSQIDTMHQHARMYGYRQATLSYTRLYIPRHIYYKFRDIYASDVDLRNFIEKHRDDLPTTFPIEYQANLRSTRPGVLEASKVDALHPGMQIFPNYVIVPQASSIFQTGLDEIAEIFGYEQGTVEGLQIAARPGARISSNQAISLVAPIRTASRNTWRDRTIGTVISKVTETMETNVLLRFRKAERRVREEGFMSTGTLSGAELRAARAANMPTLWLMATTTTSESEVGAGHRFLYPTFVLPDSFGRLFIFNRE